MALTIVEFACGDENIGVLVHEEAGGATAAIDAPDAVAIAAELAGRNWRLDLILVTHNHSDHTAGILALKAAYGCAVVGSATERAPIPGLDRQVEEGARLPLGGSEITVLATPGHTLGDVTYYVESAHAVFVGDVLFAMGCGRLFEGTAAMMWASLARLRDLPEKTRAYCGHDYAATNARFALTVDPDNAALKDRAEQAAGLAKAGILFPPTTIGLERATNPFLRVDEPAIRRALNLPSARPAEVFAELRRRKDVFA